MIPSGFNFIILSHKFEILAYMGTIQNYIKLYESKLNKWVFKYMEHADSLTT